MKKTKFLTCLAALTLLLAGCETAAENLDSDTTGTESGDTTTSDTGTGGDTGTGEGGDGSDDGDTGTGGDTGEGGDGSGESRLGLLGEAFKLVGGANYTLTCYSTAVNTDDHLSYSGYVTSEGAISTSYTGSTTGMINDPDDGGFVEVTLDGDVLKASAAPDPTRSVQDYYISSNIDTALFEELEDGRFALKDEGFTSDVLQDLFPDKPFTGGLITPTQGTIFIEVEDDLSKVTYYYDSNLNGGFTVTLVVENLGTTVFPYDLTTQYVGVGSEEVTNWAAFLDSTLKASVDELLGADLDDVLPFFVPDGGYSHTGIWSGKFNLTYSGNADVWVEPLLTFGYTEVTANSEYVLEGEEVNYTVTLSSYFGNTDLYLAPTEKPSAQEEPTTWSEYLAQNAGNNIDGEADINALLGAAIDEILPYVVPECGYNFITVDTTTGCVSFTLDNAAYAASTLAEWESALIAFGYTDLGNLTYQNEAGYKVTLTDWTFIDMIYIYVYPPVDTGDEGNDDNEDLETAQAILDAAAAQTNGYAGFDNLHIDAKCPETNLANYRATATGDLTIDENNCLYGKFQWSLSDENGPRIRYYYNDNTKYYYDNMSTNGNHNYTAAAQSNGTGERTINGLISTRLNNIGISSSNYDRAFANASSIDLSSATELALDTETNGNYKLTFIYNDIWYCYKADANLNLLGAGYSSDWTSSTSFEIVYGEETTRAAIDEIMETDFFSVETWFPKQASDDEIAQAILDAADDCDYNGLDWDAFHGEYIDESMDETDTLYLTTDSDGLYGSGICLDDGDPSFEYYYKNGKEYVHNSYYSLYSVNDSDFYYGDSYDDIIDDFTSDALGDAFLLDLDDDEWTLTTLSNGYELIIETTGMVSYHTANVEYVYITDLDYNLLAVAYGYTVSLNFEGWYAEQATNEQVEASLADFDPANWGEGDGGDEATSSWADYLTDDDYAKATELLGKTLDEVLPVVLPEGLGYQQISVASSSISFDASDWFTYDGNYPYDYNALNSAWAEALIAAGYTTNDEGVTYTDGTYKVTIEYVDYSTIMGYGITWTLTLSLA